MEKKRIAEIKQSCIINRSQVKYNCADKKYQFKDNLKFKKRSPRCLLHLKAPVKLTTAALNPPKKPIYKINLIGCKSSSPSISKKKFVEEHEEDIEIDSEDDSCPHKLQAISLYPTLCPSKSGPKGNYKIQLNEDSLYITEDDSKSPIDSPKQDFIHHVPPSATQHNISQYLTHIKKKVEIIPIPKITNTYKKNIIEGYLWKQSIKRNKGWNTKYCILKHKTFIYFNDKKLCRVKGCLQFNNIRCCINYEKKSYEFE